MSNTEEKIRERDVDSKNQVYDSIHENRRTVAKLIDSVKSDAMVLGLEPQFDNIGVIFKNKIMTLSHEFRRARLSFFTNLIPNGDEDQLEDSFVGNALLDYLREINNSGIETLYLYRDEMMDYTRNLSFRDGLITIFKRLFGVRYLSQEKKQFFMRIEKKYMSIALSLLKFSIKEHGYDAIVSFIGEDMDEEAIRGILLDEVFPTLEKLGYPEIVEKLKRKYENALKEDVLAQNEKIKAILLSADPKDQKEWKKLVKEEMDYLEEIDDLLWNQGLEIPVAEAESLYAEMISIASTPITDLNSFRERIPKYTELKKKILSNYKAPDGDITPSKKTNL